MLQRTTVQLENFPFISTIQSCRVFQLQLFCHSFAYFQKKKKQSRVRGSTFYPPRPLLPLPRLPTKSSPIQKQALPDFFFSSLSSLPFCYPLFSPCRVQHISTTFLPFLTTIFFLKFLCKFAIKALGQVLLSPTFATLFFIKAVFHRFEIFRSDDIF